MAVDPRPHIEAAIQMHTRLSRMVASASKTEEIRIGATYRFDYPAGFVTLPDYTAHAGQVVTVVRQLTDDECDPECQPMFEVVAADGWLGHADYSELADLAA